MNDSSLRVLILEAQVPFVYGGAEILVRRAGPGDCLDRDGWYYDDPISPSTLVLCPATCQRVGSDTQGTLDIILGCQTIVDLK